jgi:hypothetical protein
MHRFPCRSRINRSYKGKGGPLVIGRLVGIPVEPDLVWLD